MKRLYTDDKYTKTLTERVQELERVQEEHGRVQEEHGKRLSEIEKDMYGTTPRKGKSAIKTGGEQVDE